LQFWEKPSKTRETVFIMGRPPRLKPVFSPTRNRWIVNVPPALSDTGKRRQIFFEHKGEAQSACEVLKIRRDNFAHSLNWLTPSRIAEAGEAFEILEPLGIGLLDAVRHFVAEHTARTTSVTFRTLFEMYLAEKSDRHPRYLSQLKFTLKRMPTLHDRMVSDISHREIEDILRPLSPGARNPQLRYLKMVFRFGVKRGYLKENPIDRLDFVRRPRLEVEVVPVDHVTKMLRWSLEHDLGLLLGFFCGIRPENELLKILWSDIKGTEIVVRPQVSKTNRRRFVDISDNARAWLDAYTARGGVTTGRVTPYPLTTVQYRHHRLREACGITKWPNSGQRHTFCSCWLAVHHDVNKLVLMSGHSSPAIMWERYHAGIPEAEAKAFWEIRPPVTEERKIIQLSG
jgi:integrase